MVNQGVRNRGGGGTETVGGWLCAAACGGVTGGQGTRDRCGQALGVEREIKDGEYAFHC